MADTLLGEWIFSTTAGSPATGQIRMDNATQNLATKVGVHKQDANGTDASAALTPLKLGGRINLQIKTDATKSQTYSITGTPVDQSTYIDYPVAWVSGDQPLTGQRTNLTNVSVPVSVTVQSPAAMQASVGTASINLTTTASVTSAAMQASVGTVSSFKLTMIFPITMDAECEAQTGNVRVIGHVHLPDMAYPSDTPNGFSEGMTLRQWYAGQAMTGFIASQAPAANLIDRLAYYCFKAADSMMAYEVQEKTGIVPPVGSPPVERPPDQAPNADQIVGLRRRIS